MNQDYTVLRELAKKLAEIAHLPVQDEKKLLWTANNDLKPVRPMVYIDQLPWHEINTSEEMRLQCKDPYLRQQEQRIRETLYRWNHFPCDMVVEKRIDIQREIHNLNYGMNIVEDTCKTDEDNDIVSHRYHDQVKTYEQLNDLQCDNIWVDHDLDATHIQLCNEIFDGILPVRLEGIQIHAGVWDRIAEMKSVESVLWDIVDRPEFVVDLVNKFVDITMNTVDQCEALGLLDPELQYVHCTGAYTNDLPKDGIENGVKAHNVWAFGMAQMLATVSPEMHKEFEIDLVSRLYERFGLLYYGCCEPLEKQIESIRRIKNVRKISVSPWADIDMSAANIGRDYVFSCKSKSFLMGAGSMDEFNITKQLKDAVTACKRNNTPLEFILKDVSTVGYKLDYLDRWNDIAMKIAMSY